MRVDADRAKRLLAKLADRLEDGDDLAQDFTSFLVDKAQSNAAARPTPQSALVADALVVSGNTIRSAGIPADDVAVGSEFGSDVYLQFQHPHTTEGLWLYPAAEDQDVLKRADESLDDLIKDTV